MGEQRPLSPVATPLEDASIPPFDPEASGAAWTDGGAKKRQWGVSSPRGILMLATGIKFAVVLSGMMVMLPFFRVLEDAFCHRHFGDTSPGFIEEKKCKVPEVQQDLAYLMGWLMLVTAVVGEWLAETSKWRSVAAGSTVRELTEQALSLLCLTALSRTGITTPSFQDPDDEKPMLTRAESAGSPSS
ncbi:hypothetical protein IMZ48_27060 [Candidatus Bathyarchaeota archaeon]|nr:hypothetical protein [Candidatus Bathyarchaeota archaeon]